MKLLRKINNNKTSRERIRNQIEREECDVERVTDWMNRRRREWDLYVSLMDDNGMVIVARDDKPKGRRSVGRPNEKMERQHRS